MNSSAAGVESGSVADLSDPSRKLVLRRQVKKSDLKKGELMTPKSLKLYRDKIKL